MARATPTGTAGRRGWRVALALSVGLAAGIGVGASGVLPTLDPPSWLKDPETTWTVAPPTVVDPDDASGTDSGTSDPDATTVGEGSAGGSADG